LRRHESIYPARLKYLSALASIEIGDQLT